MTLGLGDLAFLGGLTEFPVWDARADLVTSLAAGNPNPNGRWTYGRKNNSLTFDLLNKQRADGWGHFEAFDIPLIVLGGIGLSGHTPGDPAFGKDVSLRWTAPSVMTVSIDVRISKTATGGDGVTFRLRTTGNAVINESGQIQGPSGSHEYFNSAYAVTAGQHLDFDVDMRDNAGSDTFAYDRVIITRVA
jgi:hypothetical protein